MDFFKKLHVGSEVVEEPKHPAQRVCRFFPVMIEEDVSLTPFTYHSIYIIHLTLMMFNSSRESRAN